jgi:putative peptide zinc metalloprotease protein
MAENDTDRSAKIFHDSWYRIGDQRVALRSTVRIHRQFYRGEKWYVLFDPFTNQHYRLHRSAYEFVSRLSPQRTIESAWLETLERDPENAPGQGEAIEILAQLYQANMLQYELAQDSRNLFERHRNRQRKKIRSTLANILFLRIPLFDPDALLKRIRPAIELVISRYGLVAWLLVVGTALKLALDNFDKLGEQAEGVLAPSNLFLLYGVGFLVKLVHESGHAFAVRRYGGEVHAMGVMFMMLAPLPYTDATASWSFRSKWKRILVGGAGMLFEFFVAGLALIAWANIHGGVWHSVAYNAFFIASVTTLLFNINPLMKFDGYYMLADLLDMPNLQQHATEHLRYLLEKHGFKRHDATTPARDRREGAILALYGILSAAYKIVLFSGIVVSISRHYLLLAAFMGTFIFVSWVVVPCVRFVRYIVSSPQLHLVRQRAVATTAGAFATMFALVALVPVPETFTAPGVVQARERSTVVNGATGRVAEIRATPGELLRQGDTIAILTNPELTDRILQNTGALHETQARFQQEMAGRPENLLPLARKIEALEQEAAKLEQDRSELAVRAKRTGIWVAPYAGDLVGKWIPKGDSLGELIDTTSFDFLAVIAQEEVSRLFSRTSQNLSVRLKGQAETTLRLEEAKAIPMEHTRLPSAALGWYGGGDVAVDPQHGDALRTVEPFYLVRSPLPKAGIAFQDGRSGKIRFHLGWSPLLPQGWRKLRQQLQKYYRL